MRKKNTFPGKASRVTLVEAVDALLLLSFALREHDLAGIISRLADADAGKRLDLDMGKNSPT